MKGGARLQCRPASDIETIKGYSDSSSNLILPVFLYLCHGTLEGAAERAPPPLLPPRLIEGLSTCRQELCSVAST